MINFLQIKETCLYVSDLEQARAFYCGKLELEEINYTPDKHLFLRVGTSVLLLFNPDDSKLKQSPPAHYGGGHQHFAFEVDENEYEAARRKILSLGIQIIDEVTWKTGKNSFYFNDPAGNILEIVPKNGIWL